MCADRLLAPIPHQNRGIRAGREWACAYGRRQHSWKACCVLWLMLALQALPF